MSKTSKTALFLARKSYRQRRLRDSARMLPVLGMILWIIPVMWTQDDEAPMSNADAMLFIFGVWIVLVILSAVITRSLRAIEDTE